MAHRGVPVTAVRLPRKIARRLNPAQRYGLRLTLAGLAIVTVAIPFSALTFEVIGHGPVSRFDARLANHMNDLTTVTTGPYLS